MGSVMNEMECPQCRGIMFCDYYYKTNEEYRFCKRCGRVENWTLVRNNDGKIVLKNDNWEYNHIRKKGYGVLRIAGTDGFAQLSALSQKVKNKDVRKFFEVLKEEWVDKADCYLMKWDETTKSVIPIYGNLPPDYSDEYGGEAE